MPGTSIDLFVIGAMKAATTGLCDWLGAQPDIAMSVPKEPAVFVSEEALERWLPRLDSLYVADPTAAVRAEGSTDYTKFPSIQGVPQRVRRQFPDARFVYVMRHPIERAVSQYRFDWLQGGDRLPFHRAMVQTPQLVDNGRYAFQLAPWLECFSPDRFLLVFAEAFALDAAAQVARVLEFLDRTPAGEVQVPRSIRSNQTDLLVRPSAARRLLRRSALGRRMRPYVPEPVVQAYKRRLRQRSQPGITEADRHALTEVYDADLQTLTQLTAGPGISCASWHQVVPTWVPKIALG